MMKVVDMHCDTILKLYDDLHHGKEGSLLENDGHIDLKKMQKSRQREAFLFVLHINYDTMTLGGICYGNYVASIY